MNKIIDNYLSQELKAELTGVRDSDYYKAEADLDAWLDSKIKVDNSEQGFEKCDFIHQKHEQRLNDEALEYALYKSDREDVRNGW